MNLYKREWTRADGSHAKSEYWHVRFRVKGREYRLSTGCRDKSAASLFAADEIRRRELKAAGIHGPGTIGRVPLDRALADYAREIERRGMVERSRRIVERRLAEVFENVREWADVDAAWIRRRLDAIQDRRGFGAGTRDNWLYAIRGLSSWLVSVGLAAEDVAARVALSPPAAKVPERERRALTREEIDRLLGCHGIPLERRLVYRVAITTGLRRSEMAQLRVAHFDAASRVLDLPARSTKAKRRATQPVPAETARRLAEFVAGAKPTATVFRKIPTVGTLARDLERAGVERETPDGVVDFHALRVTYCVQLCLAGAPEFLAQKLMRHKSADLTRRVYARFAPRDAREVVDRIEL